MFSRHLSTRLSLWLAAHPLSVIPHARVLLIAAGGFFVLGLVLFGVRGINWGIDFVGGVVLEVTVEEGVSVSDVATLLQVEARIPGVVVQSLDQGQSLLIRAKGDGTAAWDDPQAAAEFVRTIQDRLRPMVLEFRRTDFIGPTVGRELIGIGIQSLALAVLGIFCYIWSRFRWQFALTACIALMYDMFAVVTFFILTGYEFNLPTIAALLTTLGYSINDTVVVFDRVRENMRRFRTRDLRLIYNKSINDVLSRTLLTSLTTIVALLGITALATSVVQEFTLAIIWGVVFGTVSSVVIAVPLLDMLRVTRADAES